MTGFFVGTLLIAMIALQDVNATSARGLQTVVYAVDPELLDDIAVLLALSDAQKSAAGRFFAEYWISVSELDGQRIGRTQFDEYQRLVDVGIDLPPFYVPAVMRVG
jgi:hypothetical protein